MTHTVHQAISERLHNPGGSHRLTESALTHDLLTVATQLEDAGATICDALAEALGTAMVDTQPEVYMHCNESSHCGTAATRK